jgi:hypothetical protein
VVILTVGPISDAFDWQFGCSSASTPERRRPHRSIGACDHERKDEYTERANQKTPRHPLTGALAAAGGKARDDEDDSLENCVEPHAMGNTIARRLIEITIAGGISTQRAEPEPEEEGPEGEQEERQHPRADDDDVRAGRVVSVSAPCSMASAAAHASRLPEGETVVHDQERQLRVSLMPIELTRLPK